MKTFRNFFGILAVILSFFAVSCSLFGDEEHSAEENVVEPALTASVRGSVEISGAVPGALRSSAARTALPSLGEEISYSVVASGGGSPYEADVDAENLSFSFGELAVVEGGTEYTITATGKSGGVAVLFGEVTETLRPGDSLFCEVPVKPDMKSGKGTVNLEIDVSETEIRSCAVNIPGEDLVISPPVYSGGKITWSAELDSGCYDAVFSFYNTESASDGNRILLYEFRESVHVCKSLVTDSWFGSSSYITDGKCVVTDDLVKKFALSRIYVSSKKSDSKETGTRGEPYKSVARAMNALLDKDTDYTILVDGELMGAQEIPASLKKDGTGAYKAKSLTISGATGNTTDSLKGGFTSSSNGTTLKILTDVPVTIKNLKITGGYAAQSSSGGGGLYAKGDVTLSEGALVSGNYTASCGGGIYNDSKNLTIESGAEISGNYEKGISNCGGGGIFNYGGTLVISGGVIKANSADHDGGAIYTKEGTCYIYGNTLIGKDVTAAPCEWYNGSNKAENGGAICVNGGNVYIGYKNNNGTASKDDEASVKVTGNAVKSSSSKGGGIYVAAGIVQIAETSVGFNYSPKDGGGIYTTGTVRLMEDAVIKGNKAYSYGGGVHVNKKGSLSMTGNSIIGGSESGEENTAASGGGVYVASNSAVTGDEATVTFGVSGASVSPSITGNSATSGGGGVYVENFAATFNMNSGSISNNKLVGGTTGGGGVEISYGTFNMNGGTISGNYIENPGTSTLGGAVDINTNGKFNIKGTVSIPYDGESGKNDVSIRSNSITITGEITPPEDAGSVATIVPSSYTTGVQVLSEAEDSMMIRNYGKYFDISPVSGETWKIDCIMNYGVLVATRIVDSREYFEYKAGDADALKNMFSSLNSMTSEDTGNICITLQDDIDMSSSTDWMPIGFATRALALDEGNPHVVFYGVFDGDGHTITISDNNSTRCYVICWKNTGIIQNLKIKSTRTITFSQAGVWGPDDPATAHCQFSGFCFLNEEGIIRNCWNAIDCDGRGISATGGICSVNRGTVENCINTGSITSMWHTGSGTGAWSGIYMTAGGIAGENSSWDGGMNGVIKNCVNYGTIKGNKRADDSVSLNGIVGAIAGLSNNAGNEIVDCYWRTDCVYSNTSTGTSVSDNLNWMLCKASNRYTSDVRAGTLTGNGSFAANNNGTLAAASADDAGTAQTLQYGTNLLTALNSFVSDNPDDGICEWKSGSSYAAIPECFSDD